MSQPSVRVSVFGKTDLGRTREHNEDTFLVADLSTRRASLQPDVREHPVGERGSLFMVADGMGGAAAGELASEMATQEIYGYMARVWTNDEDRTAQRFAARLKEAVEHANERLFAYAAEHPEVRGMGTTVTAAGVYEDILYLTQIGDSRGYLVRGREAIQLTKDQSLTQRLVDAGELTEEEAERSERRNIILQALGPDPRVRVDLTWQQLRRDDLLIICSDGLSGLVRKEEIAETAAVVGAPDQLCAALIDLANSRGGPDNITVVAARFDGDALADAESSDEPGYRRYPLGDDDTSEHALPPARNSETGGPPIASAMAPAPVGQGLPRPATIAALLVLIGLLAIYLVAR